VLDREGLSHHGVLLLSQDLACDLLLVLAPLSHVDCLPYLLNILCVNVPLLHRISWARTLEHAVDLLILLQQFLLLELLVPLTHVVTCHESLLRDCTVHKVLVLSLSIQLASLE